MGSNDLCFHAEALCQQELVSTPRSPTRCTDASCVFSYRQGIDSDMKRKMNEHVLMHRSDAFIALLTVQVLMLHLKIYNILYAQYDFYLQNLMIL